MFNGEGIGNEVCSRGWPEGSTGRAPASGSQSVSPQAARQPEGGFSNSPCGHPWSLPQRVSAHSLVSRFLVS